MTLPRADRTAFFMHIPKTAGISFYEALSTIFSREEIHPIPVPPPGDFLDASRFPVRVAMNLEAAHREFDPREARQYRLVMGHWDHGIVERAPELEPFVILRDPVTRTVSEYKHAARTNDAWNRHAHERIRAGMRLVDMANDPQIVAVLAAAQARQVAGYTWSRPQEKPRESELFARAEANLTRFACVGVVERLREFGLLLSYAFGWPPITAIPRANVAPNDLEVPITPAIRDGIRQVCHVDVALHEHAIRLYNRSLIRMLGDLLADDPRRSAGLREDETEPLAIPDETTFRTVAERIRERAETRRA